MTAINWNRTFQDPFLPFYFPRQQFISGCYLGSLCNLLCLVWSPSEALGFFFSNLFLIARTISTSPYSPCLQGGLIGLIRALSLWSHYKSLTWHDMREKQREIWEGRQGALQCQSQHAFHVDGTECFLILPLPEATQEIISHITPTLVLVNL